MYNNETILEFDFPSPKRRSKRFLVAIVLHISLISFFILSGSYQNPTLRVDNKLVSCKTAQFQNSIKTRINSLIALNKSDTSQNINNQINELLVKFYETRDYKPAWTHSFSTNQQFSKYLNLLDSAKYYGFPFDYFSNEKIKILNEYLTNNIKEKDFLNTITNLEFTTTYSALKLLVYLNQGIIEKDTSSAFLSYIETLPEVLNNALNQTDFSSKILSVQPNLVQHHNLLNSLPYFIDLHLSIKYTTPELIDDKLLAKSLYYVGITEISIFDSINNKPAALFKLQEQFQLPKDIILNDETHQVLVSLLQYRYYQVCLNLNRLRKLKHSSDNYLFVNIPEFQLHVIESNEIKEVFNVIVGKKKTPTPTLSSSIEKVIANPYWTIPKSIVTNEMIYKIRKDSTYLERNGYFVINNYGEIVDESKIDWNEKDPLGNRYWLRQSNSRHNALGQVKFIFPNNYSIYLHDTQAKGLFRRNARTFSHGCIRLENPDKLAQYLSDHYYSENDINIQTLILNNERNVIDLSEKINIHIQYITCSGNENSGIIFYNDVYNLDDEEIKAIFQEPLEI